MKSSVVSRIIAAGVAAAALVGLGVVTSAQSSKPSDRSQQEEKKDAAPQKAKKDNPQQKPGNGHERQGQEARRSSEAQQQLIYQQQQRLAQYRDQLDQQQRVAPQQSAQLQRQNRTAQYGYQQQYQERMHQQWLQVRGREHYDYGRDPYFTTSPTYRYSRGGRYYETNQYGVDLLRQAVSYGYDEGCLAGMADRQDRWKSSYRDSYAYQDANYGYGGFYVDRADYNAYFREGFRRGYEDGYNRRSQYGVYVSGRGTVLGAVLATILNFESIR
jgi:hypothetical protein